MIALVLDAPPATRRAMPPWQLERVDADGLARLWALCREASDTPLPAHAPLPLREALLDAPYRAWAWLARSGDRDVGVLVASVGLDLPGGEYGLRVDGLYVKPAWRGGGIGEGLRMHAQRVADDMGCARVHWPAAP